MKKLFLGAAVMMVSLFSLNEVKAQVNVSINIGSQPLWGPTGYDHVDYYYLPDVESYYSVNTRQFIYSNGKKWIYADKLPGRYNNYNLYDGYKVVVNSPNPYLNFKKDKVKYARFKGYRGQNIIRDSKDSRYSNVKGRSHGTPPGQAKKNDNRYDDHRDNRGNDRHNNSRR